jgi:hypothetical protein
VTFLFAKTWVWAVAKYRDDDPESDVRRSFCDPNFRHLFMSQIHFNHRHGSGASGLGLKRPGP